MTEKHHIAILAKNDIARQIRNWLADADEIDGFTISPEIITACLYQIEEFIGKGNQPSVGSILDDKKERI